MTSQENPEAEAIVQLSRAVGHLHNARSLVDDDEFTGQVNSAVSDCDMAMNQVIEIIQKEVEKRGCPEQIQK